MPALTAPQLTETGRLSARVPFNFVVANNSVPNREIMLQRADDTGRVLVIRNVEAKLNIFATASGKKVSARGGQYLVFNKYGDRYFLSALKVEGSDQIYAFYPGKPEGEMMAQSTPEEQVLIVASKSRSSNGGSKKKEDRAREKARKAATLRTLFRRYSPQFVIPQRSEESAVAYNIDAACHKQIP